MSQTDEQIVELVSAALESAMELANEEDGWKVEKEQGEATVKSKKNKEGRKVWLCTALVDISPKDLWAKLLDTDNLTSWNTTLTESKTIKKLDGDVKVSYQVTAEGGGWRYRVSQGLCIWLQDCREEWNFQYGWDECGSIR